MCFSAHILYTSIKSLHQANKTLHSWAILAYPRRLQSIHLSVRSTLGACSHGPPQRKVQPSLKCHSRSSPLLPSLPGPLVCPEQASSHCLSFAQQVPGPGCPFLPSLVKPSASFKPSSAPGIPASLQPPWAALSLSPHRPLRKQHSPCLSRPR